MQEQKQSAMIRSVYPLKENYTGISPSGAHIQESYDLDVSEFSDSLRKKRIKMEELSEFYGGLYGYKPGLLFSSQLIKEYKPIQLENHEKLSVKQSVANLLTTAGQEDWDGENALAVSSRTVEIAVKLVGLLPGFLAPPNVSASPQGEIDFTWDVSENAMLTVSVCPSDEIAFAGVFKDLKLYGTRPWTEMLLPSPVQFCFEMLRESTVSETGN